MFYDVALIAALTQSPMAYPVTPAISYQVQGISSLAVSLMRGDFHSDVTTELNKYGFGAVQSIQSFSSSGVVYGDPFVKQSDYLPIGYKVTSYKIQLGSIAGKNNSATVQVDYRVENDGDTFLDLQVFGTDGQFLSDHSYRDYVTAFGKLRTQETVEQWGGAGVISTSIASTHYSYGVVTDEYSSQQVQMTLAGVNTPMVTDLFV
jgi:hypothetical protein